MEKYILTKSMHFGFLKETFGRGAVITFDPSTRKVTIEGRQFDDYRDVEILKRQSVKKPHDPWVIPFSAESLNEIIGTSGTPEPLRKRSPNGEGLGIERSDEDQHETIDISHTRISKNNQAEKDAKKQRIKDEGLEIVRGDETAEERISRLKESKTTDLSARAERVRLMSERKAKMEIVRDDSLGSVGGSKASALNAGGIVGGKRPEEADDSVIKAAELRKQEAEIKRRHLLEAEGIDQNNLNIEVAVGPDDSPNISAPMRDNKDLELTQLRAELESIRTPIPVDPRDAEIAKLRAELEAVRSTPINKVRKKPVTDAATALAFKGE